MMHHPILIAGGGIGGLTAALALARRGFDVQLFEKAEAFGEVGAGIQLSANATRVLFALGLGDALESIAFLPQTVQMRHWRSGRVLSKNTLGATATARFGFPYFHVHRADLLKLLVEAVQREPRVRLQTASSVLQFEDTGKTVHALVDTRWHEGAALIGADGIHSTVRNALFGAQAPRFTGNVAWRALVPAERLPAGLVQPAATVWWGPGKHFVHYYVRAGALVNCVCVVEQTGWERESWTEPGDHGELQAAFGGWHPALAQVIQAMDPTTCFRWALHDRPPMAEWSRGRVTLLGDACHPTLPFMAQGACMAIEDAAVLARSLEAAADPGTALMRYAKLRQPRTARIQGGSRRNATVFHLSGVKAWLRNRAAARLPASALDWVYGYDALGVPLNG